MSKITKAARGRECLIRVPGVCIDNPETVIAAHYRSISLGAGTGFKNDDWFSAHSCAACHDAVDGRRPTLFTHDELRLMHAEGVFRTQLVLIDAGVIRS